MKVFKNQITDPQEWGKKTRDSHLYNAGYSSIQTSKTIERLIDLDIGANNFVNFVESLPSYELNEEGPYRYALQGIEERNYPLIKATIDAAGTTLITDNHKAGYKGGVFYLWYDDDFFSATSSLTSNHPEQFVLRVTGDGVKVGMQVRYQVQLLATSESELFVPASEVVAGSKWVDRFGLVENTESIRGTEVSHASHFMLQNSTSVLRKNYEVPGNMISKGVNHPLEWEFVADNGKRFKTWLPKLDYDFNVQFKRDKANLYLYGKATTIGDTPGLIKGESGNTVKAGLGLYEFMNTGNIKYYNNFSIDNLAKFILDITYNMVSQDKRNIVVSTGEYGAYQFHQALMNKAASYPWLESGHNLKFESGKVILDEGEMVGYNFVNGIKIRLILDKMKDNPIHNMMLHPSGGPITSYIYDIYDFGTTNGKPNIQKLKIKDYEELFGYIPGMRDPFQPYNNLGSPRMMATSKDGYSVFKQWAGGIHVNNPKKTGRYIPSIYQL
jgi:hypothetical protein